MKKAQKPHRLSTYSNLVRKKARPTRKVSSKSRIPIVRWFTGLSRRKKIAVLLLPLTLFLIITPIVTYLMLANDIKDQERLMNRNNTGIVLLDSKGKAFYSLGKAEHRTMIPLSELPKQLQQALIATEDKDFYKHGGFNLGSIVRSLWTNIVLRKPAYGGSTITQQLVKNTLLTDDKNVLRKYQELAMSIAIEQNYSKDEILAMYLNSVYYGENAFGIEEAARVYFGKAPKDLDLAESSMLIGILPAPSVYSPISGNADYAKERQKKVLTRMVATGYITDAQKDAAYEQALSYATSANRPDSIAPHFVEMVISQLSKTYGYEQVMRSGFQVTTTLDTSAQNIVNESVKNQIGFVNKNGGSNIAAVVVDPKTGEVRALVGSADYNNSQWGKVNMATTARQPGSSFKPIYYAQALADGVITPATVIKDEKTDFGGYIPMNASRQWYGDVTVRKALSWSLNIPSVKVMQQYSIDKSVAGAKKLGIELNSNRSHDLTLALGSEEVPLLTMTNAYAAFANQGEQYQTAVIHSVEDKFGKKIMMNSATGKRAISKEGAYLISSILSDNQARAGIFGSSLTVSGYTAAVKTGTTDNSRDAWTIGYTPHYAVGVWVGNNDNQAMQNGGSGMAGPVWRNTLQQLLKGSQNQAFTMPSNIVERAVCSASGGLAKSAGKGTYNEFFLAGALPTNSCEAEPTMIDVCETAAGKVISIDEKTFDATKHSKDAGNCKPPQLQACDLTSGTVVTIDQAAYDEKKYSKDVTNCHKQPTTSTVSACNLASLKIEQVDADTYDKTKYTTNYQQTNSRNCTPA
ncbi:MAG: PBP1A family penicillin-binding protein [Candidatus Saccharimonas sp.]